MACIPHRPEAVGNVHARRSMIQRLQRILGGNPDVTPRPKLLNPLLLGQHRAALVQEPFCRQTATPKEGKEGAYRGGPRVCGFESGKHRKCWMGSSPQFFSFRLLQILRTTSPNSLYSSAFEKMLSILKRNSRVPQLPYASPRDSWPLRLPQLQDPLAKED